MSIISLFGEYEDFGENDDSQTQETNQNTNKSKVLGDNVKDVVGNDNNDDDQKKKEKKEKKEKKDKKDKKTGKTPTQLPSLSLLKGNTMTTFLNEPTAIDTDIIDAAQLFEKKGGSHVKNEFYDGFQQVSQVRQAANKAELEQQEMQQKWRDQEISKQIQTSRTEKRKRDKEAQNIIQVDSTAMERDESNVVIGSEKKKQKMSKK